MDNHFESRDFNLAAIDLGATSGRVILGGIDDGVLRMKQAARFPNTPLHLTEVTHTTTGGGTASDSAASAGSRSSSEGLYWNIQALYRSIEDGLREALRIAPGVRSIGIDSWAVDYGLFRRGRLLGIPHHYRDERSARGVEIVHSCIDETELFARNGLQHLDFNTVFQLAVEAESGLLEVADEILLIPDLLAYWLTGNSSAEMTNASTTGLLSVIDQSWDTEILDHTQISRDLLPALVGPGQRIGQLTEAVANRIGTGSPITVTAVGSHDTASAIVAVPFASQRAAYISSGTWSLVGLELDQPVLTEAAQKANFTNEGGVDGTIRFLKNVSGLWLLSESIRHWFGHSTEEQRASKLQTLLAEAGALSTEVPVFDPSDDRFVPPGDMPSRIVDWCREHELRPPEVPAEIVRSILESLAEAYRRTVETAEVLAGVDVETIHIVGGGSQNALLCQLTAKRTGRPVIAGPVEATAIGNLLVQARATGEIEESASLADLRTIVRKSFPVERYSP